MKEGVLAAGSATAASVSWLVVANDVAQLIAAVIAIVAGALSIVIAIRKLRR